MLFSASYIASILNTEKILSFFILFNKILNVILEIIYPKCNVDMSYITQDDYYTTVDILLSTPDKSVIAPIITAPACRLNQLDLTLSGMHAQWHAGQSYYTVSITCTDSSEIHLSESFKVLFNQREAQKPWQLYISSCKLNICNLTTLIWDMHPIPEVQLGTVYLSQHDSCPSVNNNFLIITDNAQSYYTTDMNPAFIKDCHLKNVQDSVAHFLHPSKPIRSEGKHNFRTTEISENKDKSTYDLEMMFKIEDTEGWGLACII